MKTRILETIKGDEVKLEDGFWEREWTKFVANFREVGKTIKTSAKGKAKFPCKNCKKESFICNFYPCIKVTKWLCGEK